MARPRSFRLSGLIFLLLVGIGIRGFFRPPLSGWRPVFRGIDYYCENVPPIHGSSGRAVALRIQLDAPGLDIGMRPLDPAAVAKGGHYTLAWPDLERRKHDLDVLLNTALYAPGRWWESYPGRTVKAVDMVVVEGRATHLWEHSYLLWLDRTRTPHLNFYKPPKPEDIASAVWGIGVQGVQVSDGKPRPGAIGGHDHADARTFIGFDAARRLLFLLAFENVTPPAMIDTAVRLGVRDGGAMDGGTSTWLLFSPRAKGLRPFAGLRGGRPLGPYLGLRAQPLP